ncbi:hypothetical protein [Brevundimonas intermedia]|nr:hypothetical protein [Brevundimonas intermedia]
MRFALVNLAGALIWTVTVLGLGFAFGAGIEHPFGRLPVHIHLVVFI